LACIDEQLEGPLALEGERDLVKGGGAELPLSCPVIETTSTPGRGRR
jgi:hypothetical protein